jgi:hypothetical protein
VELEVDECFLSPSEEKASSDISEESSEAMEEDLRRLGPPPLPL